MTDYHLKYTHIKPLTIAIVKNLIFDNAFFRRTSEEKASLLAICCQQLSEMYNINTPNIEIINDCFGHGQYKTDTNTIILNQKISLVTFLHEFKHAMQHQKNANNSEDNARGWSLSVFYLSAPKIFNQSKRKGLIFFT